MPVDRVDPRSVEAAKAATMQPDGFWDRNHRFAFLVARENARRILADPGLIELGRAHLRRFAAKDPHQAKGYALWTGLLALPAAEIAARLVDRSEQGDFARATAPAFGALPPNLRARLVRQARSLLVEDQTSAPPAAPVGQATIRASL